MLRACFSGSCLSCFTAWNGFIKVHHVSPCATSICPQEWEERRARAKAVPLEQVLTADWRVSRINVHANGTRWLTYHVWMRRKNLRPEDGWCVHVHLYIYTHDRLCCCSHEVGRKKHTCHPLQNDSVVGSWSAQLCGNCQEKRRYSTAAGCTGYPRN